MTTEDMVSLGWARRGQCDFIGPSSRSGVTQNTGSGNQQLGQNSSRAPGSVWRSSPSIVMQASCRLWLTPLTDFQPSPNPSMSQSHSIPL